MAAMSRMTASSEPPMMNCAVRCCSGRGRVMPKVAMKVSVSQASSFIVRCQDNADPDHRGREEPSAALRDRIEQTVEEVDGFRRRVAAGDLEGFIDDDGCGG